MEWYRQVQFVAAVPMPPEMADEFGTTVNGMWASPELGSADEVADLRARGRRALFSVPMIALVPKVYERPDRAFLLEEVCRDVDGRESECDWYYWETKPVYAACIYGDVFRRRLLEQRRHGVDLGMDVVNLDEIMTSIGLMNRAAGGTGFCSRCLEPSPRRSRWTTRRGWPMLRTTCSARHSVPMTTCSRGIARSTSARRST